MPKHARNHHDMLQLCCGVCSVKKKLELHKTTPNLLSKLHQMNGYADYDLEDDRYPKVICTAHKSTVNEQLKIQIKKNIEIICQTKSLILNQLPYHVQQLVQLQLDIMKITHASYVTKMLLEDQMNRKPLHHMDQFVQLVFRKLDEVSIIHV